MVCLSFREHTQHQMLATTSRRFTRRSFNQSLIGCTDEAACNFDPTSEEDDGSCEYPVMGFDCEGNCLLDEDNDGICDPEVEGCTNGLACNYMPDATEDDGTCDFCSCPVEQLNQVTACPWKLWWITTREVHWQA